MSSYLFVAVVIVGLMSMRAQGQCPNPVGSCGDQCCPNSINVLAVTCCRSNVDCCIPGTSDAAIIKKCGDVHCPFSLTSNNIYDVGGHIRDQCCSRFRNGCCSEPENETLDLLFKLAIGLGAGLAALAAILVGLACLCVCVRQFR